MLKIVISTLGCLVLANSALAQNSDCLEQLLASDRATIPHDRFFQALGEVTNTPENCASIVEKALDPNSGKDQQPVATAANLCQSARETWGDIKSTQSPKVLDAFISYYSECPIYLALAQDKLRKFPSDGFPEKLGPFRIGDILSEGETYLETDVGGLPGYIEAITSPSGKVTHVVFYHEGASALDPLLATFTNKLGAPTEDLTTEWFPQYRWDSRDGRRRFTLGHTEPCCGSDLQMTAVLETTDSKRLCGPEDGFTAWAKDLQSAVKQNDIQYFSKMFSFPFERWEQKHDAGAEIPENESISFESAGELRAALPTNYALRGIFDALEEMDLEDMSCNIVAPEGQQVGYNIYVRSVGGLQFGAQESGWTIEGTFYTP
ncbi:hypothetical protein AB9F29_12875 [Falsihalocynthiibacter sp. S25ZX9]|uniref:hypothetical protein n=1 Tax=Falsihalocynthiibacter sp. S25ZX9 TaxID=3240870 RepID=UPI003510250E